MKDYIEREAAMDALSASALERNLDSVMTDEPHRYHRAAERCIACIPAADVQPVMYGYWIERQYPLPLSDGSKKTFECSVCLTHWDAPTNYCPHCGAFLKEDCK